MNKNKKRTLITGSTSGIGLALARGFARAGHDLVLHGLEPDGAALARGLSQEYGVHVTHSDADLSRRSGCEQLAKATQDALGGLDVLINNAGIQHVAPVEAFPADRWDAILAVNLSAAFFLSQAFWEGMRARSFGRILMLASVHGLVASEFKAAYVAAKHGVLGLTKVLALEGAPHGITCNALCPGYVRTPLVEKQIADQAQAHGIPAEDVVTQVLLKKHAIKRFVEPDALTALALLLASEDGALITGTSIPVDGGWTAQ